MFIFPRAGESWSVSPSLVASLLGSATAAAASSNGEACRRASGHSAELLKFIPLCILQYPPFFSAPFKTTSLSPSWLF